MTKKLLQILFAVILGIGIFIFVIMYFFNKEAMRGAFGILAFVSILVGFLGLIVSSNIANRKNANFFGTNRNIEIMKSMLEISNFAFENLLEPGKDYTTFAEAGGASLVEKK